MEPEAKDWIEAAVDYAERAKSKGISVLFIRRQSEEDLTDLVVTNAPVDVIKVLALAMNGPGDVNDVGDVEDSEDGEQ